MVYQKKIQKWAASVGMPDDFWVNADSAPLKEFFGKLLSSEILRTTPLDTTVIPFEKLLSIAQYKLGIHTCLVGNDLFKNDENLKLGLFATVISLKSALADYKPEILAQIPVPDFGIAGGTYENKALCQKCNKPILFIERIIVAERSFHRSCMHCYLCGKRLFLGMFRIIDDHLECFEHFLNKAITGNELLSFENAKAIKSPPPRPPPPSRKSLPTPIEEPKTSPVPSSVVEKPVVEKPIVEQKFVDQKLLEKQATPPQTKKPTSPTKTPGNGGSDQSEENNWESIDYPDQLNPFSEDDIDKLSDNMSSLNPFGSSSDEESDAEEPEQHLSPPVPAPRKLKTPSEAEEPIKETIKVEVAIKKEEPKVEEVKEEVKIEEKIEEIKVEERAEVKKEEPIKEPVVALNQSKTLYPDLKNLFVDTESETLFNFYLPSSLALCKKRQIDMTEFDKPKLLHELDKVIKTLDYIEKQNKESERILIKELAKEDFKWDKSQLVDDFGKAMKMKHENLLKGAMIVTEYLKKLLEKAIVKIDQNDPQTNRELREQLVHLQEKFTFEHSVIPAIMEDEPPKVKDLQKKKGLAKRIKKVF